MSLNTLPLSILLLLLFPLLTTSLTPPRRPSHRPSPSIATRKSSAPIASGSQILSTPTYLISASLGSPPQPLLLSLSTSSDTSWIPSSSCLGCPLSSFRFSPRNSTSFAPTPLSPSLSYGPSTLLTSLSRDTLTIGGTPIPNFTFALVNSATAPASLPAGGLLGLGRGPLSLLSQTQSTFNSTFSYCLPNYRSSNFSGSLRLGPKGQPVNIKTAPLLLNPHRPSLYYVPMSSIRVGARVLDIPPSAFAFDPATGGGTVVDPGTLFTKLVQPAYAALRDEFRRRVGRGRNATSLGGFDTCFDGVDAVPTVTFGFAGMNVTLPVENVVIRSTGSGLVCLAMAEASADPVNRVVNVIAAWQHQNHRVLFDVPNGRVGFAREQCSVV